MTLTARELIDCGYWNAYVEAEEIDPYAYAEGRIGEEDELPIPEDMANEMLAKIN